MNEANHNTMNYALEILVDNYRYVPNDTILSQGRYIRYLDLKKPLDIKLRLGGFVTNDNGYTVNLKGPEKTFRVSKKNCLFFSQINDTDKIHAAVNEYI